MTNELAPYDIIQGSAEKSHENWPDPEWDLWSDNLSEESQKAMDDELEARRIETCENE